MPEFFARKPRHTLRKGRAVGVPVQEAQRGGGRFEFAVRVVEQQLGQSLGGQIEPFLWRLSVQKGCDIVGNLNAYSHCSTSAAHCSRSRGRLASIMLMSAW